MLTATEGYVKDNQIIINENIAAYEGQRLVITFLKSKYQDAENRKRTISSNRKGIDLYSYVHRTERGQHVEEYMEEIRGNDRF